MSSSNELEELAAAEALANSIDVSSDSEEEDSDESSSDETAVQSEAVRKPLSQLALGPEQGGDLHLDSQSVKSGAGNLTDLFLSLDTSAVGFARAHMEVEEEEEDDVEEMESEGVQAGSVGGGAKRVGGEEYSMDLEEEEEDMMRDVAAAAGLQDSALQEVGFRTEEVPYLSAHLCFLKGNILE